MAVRISAERLAKANIRYIVPCRIKDILRNAPETCKNPLLSIVRTPRELVSERLAHQRILDDLSIIKNPSRIESNAIDLFAPLLRTGTDESIFMIENPHKNLPVEQQLKVLKEARLSEEQLFELRLISSRAEYVALAGGARNGQRKLIETDLSSVFSKSLAEIERDGSANIKVVARYFEFLKRALEKNMIEKEIWVHFTEEGLAIHEKLETFGSEITAEIFSLPQKSNIARAVKILAGGTVGLVAISLPFSALINVLLFNEPAMAEPALAIAAIMGFVGFTASAAVLGLEHYEGPRKILSKRQMKQLAESAKMIELVAATERPIKKAPSDETKGTLLKELDLMPDGSAPMSADLSEVEEEA